MILTLYRCKFINWTMSLCFRSVVILRSMKGPGKHSPLTSCPHDLFWSVKPWPSSLEVSQLGRHKVGSTLPRTSTHPRPRPCSRKPVVVLVLRYTRDTIVDPVPIRYWGLRGSPHNSHEKIETVSTYRIHNCRVTSQSHCRKTWSWVPWVEEQTVGPPYSNVLA